MMDCTALCRHAKRRLTTTTAATGQLMAEYGGPSQTAATHYFTTDLSRIHADDPERHGQAKLATEAQARAELRFEEVRKLANSVLFDYHDAIRNLPGSTPVRERLVKDALKYLDSLAAESADAVLQRELAAAYERLGDIQGGTMFANLGDSAGALDSHRRALAILEILAEGSPQDSALARRHFCGDATLLRRAR